MKKPEPEDFGLTAEGYHQYLQTLVERDQTPILSNALGMLYLALLAALCGAAGLATFLITRDWGYAILFTFWAFFPSAWIIIALGLLPTRLRRFDGPGNPFGENSHAANLIRYQRYQYSVASYNRAQQEAERAQRKAQVARRRTLESYWGSLDGKGFERELGSLYKGLGYTVNLTPTSGDNGIDLVLKKAEQPQSSSARDINNRLARPSLENCMAL